MAELIRRAGAAVTTTLAGRTDSPLPIAGAVRTGGFGSVEAMAQWLRDVGATALLDAAHPFAATMHHRCAQVAAETSLPLLRLERPSWLERPDAGGWMIVAGHDEAVAAIRRRPALVTVGKQHAHRYDHPGAVLRMTELPPLPIRSAEVVLVRGPFTAAQEREMFARHGIATLVTKDSGGEATSAKLDVAAELGVDVVVVARPAAAEGVPTVSTVTDAVAWALSHRRA